MSGGGGPLRPPAIARGKIMTILYYFMVFLNTTPLDALTSCGLGGGHSAWAADA